MKIFCIAFSLSCIISAQIEDAPELYLTTMGISNNETNSFRLIQLGNSYTTSQSYVDLRWEICATCDPQNIPITIAGNIGVTNAHGWSISLWDPYPTNDRPLIGHGLYKLTNGFLFCYLDYRDDRFHNFSPIGYLTGSPDGIVTLDSKWTIFRNDDEFLWQILNEFEPVTLLTAEYSNVWSGFGFETPHTQLLDDFWQNCMAADFEQGYTTVFWGRHPTFNNITKYKLYMAITHSSQIPAESSFSMIKDFSPSTFHYQNFIVPTEYNYLHFFIRAEDSELGISERTNIVTIPQQLSWEESLQLFVENSNPKLVWGPHPSTNYNSGFNVYRAIVSPGQPEPAEGNFALLTPNGSSISKKLSVMK